MNFEATNELLEAIKPYTKNATVTISSENDDYKGASFDLVTVDKNHEFCFEVFEDEIIVFFITDHYHFEDYSSEYDDESNNYIKRATTFLLELLQNKVKHVKIFKGKNLASEKYFMLYSDNTKEKIGGIWWGLVRVLNPFAKRTEEAVTYKFNTEKGIFDEI